MSSFQREIDERTHLSGTNQFELLLFGLGTPAGGKKPELYGINVFKVREIVSLPDLTPIAGASQHSLGVVRLREQVIPVYDLPGVIGCRRSGGSHLMIVTEYARSTQAFAVESVEDIARLDWSEVTSAESGGAAGSLVTSIARLEDAAGSIRLVQVLDVETILQIVAPQSATVQVNAGQLESLADLSSGKTILVADDSSLARKLLEQTLEGMHLRFEMFKSGKETWERLDSLADAATNQGRTVCDEVSLVLTDLEMPEMDGFTLTRHVKEDPRMKGLPVLVHSSLSGATNEVHVRGVGADGYVVKFSAGELGSAIRRVLA